MELVFLACFVFGVLFTIVSFALGFADLALPGADGAGAPLASDAGDLSAVALDAGGADGGAHAASKGLPLFNISSLLAFLTWFGGAGYALLVFAGWPLAGAIAVAVLVGAVGALLVSLFLGRVLAGERVMSPRDYRVEGTIARVTVTIPANGVGEILFEKAGTRRSEAARSESGREIPRGTEVVVLQYERGIATVQPWAELLPERQEHGSRAHHQTR